MKKLLLVKTKSIEFDIFQFHRRVILIFLGCMVVLVPVQAASFDCRKSASKIEKLICNTPVISNLDDEIAKVYKDALKNINDEQKQRLVLDQKHWIKYTRNICNDEACVSQAYAARSKDIAALIDSKSNVVVTDTVKNVHASQSLNGEQQTSKTVPISLEEIQGLLNMQANQLQAKQKSARDVLFFRGGMPKDETGICERFWRAVETKTASDLPKPAMLAVLPQEKEKLFVSLQNFAKSNFERYLSQDGNLIPDKYTDDAGRSWRLGPFVKGQSNNLKDLPQKFKDVWQRDPSYHGFFDKNDLLDQSLTINLLYMQPYPITGYVRPLLVAIQKDRCDKCTGISMGMRTISVDGLPQPDWMKGKYFSQTEYVEVEAQSNRDQTAKPIGPYLLMGLRKFESKLIFWTLREQAWVEPSVRESEEDIHYYKSGDAKSFFRKYEIDVISLDEPRYEGPKNTCTIKFN